MKYLCTVDFTRGGDQTQGQYEIEAVDAYHANEVLQITLRKFCLPDVKIFVTSVKSIKPDRHKYIATTDYDNSEYALSNYETCDVTELAGMILASTLQSLIVRGLLTVKKIGPYKIHVRTRRDEYGIAKVFTIHHKEDVLKQMQSR